MLISDWGRKGVPDLRISNDRHYYLNDGKEQLWKLSAKPKQYGSEDGWVTISFGEWESPAATFRAMDCQRFISPQWVTKNYIHSQMVPLPPPTRMQPTKKRHNHTPPLHG